MMFNAQNLEKKLNLERIKNHLNQPFGGSMLTLKAETNQPPTVNSAVLCAKVLPLIKSNMLVFIQFARGEPWVAMTGDCSSLPTQITLNSLHIMQM